MARLRRCRRPPALSLRREGLAALSGLLLALSFPKYGSGLVAWVALTPLLVALVEAPSPSHGFRLGYVTGALSSLGIGIFLARTHFGYRVDTHSSPLTTHRQRFALSAQASRDGPEASLSPALRLHKRESAS